MEGVRFCALPVLTIRVSSLPHGVHGVKSDSVCKTDIKRSMASGQSGGSNYEMAVGLFLVSMGGLVCTFAHATR